MSSELARQPRIMIVEDNPLDVILLCEALADAGFSNEPMVLNDGAVAMSMLRGESPFEREPPPDLVILDLNLRLVDGPEVLRYIRETAGLQKTRVVILSSSPTDVMRVQAANADAYFTKPSELDVFCALGKKIWDIYFAT